MDFYRRRFLKLGALAAAAPLVQSCSRRNVSEPVIASMQSTVEGFIWSRTAIAVGFTCPQIACPNPIAAALYCRRGNTSRGTTRTTAPQTMQR